ncbi:MAG: glycosyltransferase family 2 protein [Bacteroidia bacterium]|nr:MAG: glycosyltransferase family 2 protein [Bacteroidia bacterium]
MKVSGFSFIKNALIYDFPIAEAIKSILPICDEFVVAVGESDDNTLDLIAEIDPGKIKIIETQWNESLREGGRVLALETDKAFAQLSEDSDWAFYIQGDEVVHEKYLDTIYDGMLKCKDDTRIDGLLFKYLHFYGSFDYVGASSKWYKHEIRVVRNDKSIYSYKDAQGFRKGNNEKLRVKAIDAYMYHYGWVKEPATMQSKLENNSKYWHDDQWIDENVRAEGDSYAYDRHVNELKLFTGEHPLVMKKRIEAKNWKFDYDISRNRKSTKDKFKRILQKVFGIDIAYKNYRIAK